MSKTTSLLVTLIVAVVFVSSQAFAGGMETYGYYRSDVPEMKRAVSGETVEVRIMEAPDRPAAFRDDVTEVQGAMPSIAIGVSREYVPHSAPELPAVTCTIELEALESARIMERPDVPEIALASAYEGSILSACAGTGVREPEGAQRMDIPEMWYYGSPAGG